MRPVRIAFVVFVLGMVLGACGSTTPPAKQAGSLPLRFEPNLGQADPRVVGISRGADHTLLLTRDGAMLKLRDAAIRMTYVGANPAPRVSERGRLPGVSNYLRGRDPRRWITGVPSFSQIVYGGLYQGVDLTFHASREGKLEFDYALAPGADPDAIRLAYRGARSLRVDRDGALVLRAGRSVLRQLPPVVTQEGRQVAARYVLHGHGQVGFALERYDRHAALLIDPVLSYSTYLGGSGDDNAIWTDVDRQGNFYATGITDSTDYPTTPGAYQRANGGSGDVFVTKLDPRGSGLVWSTYLGGAGDEAAVGLDVDRSGNVVVTGDTNSADFPTTRGAYQRESGGGDNDAFVTKLDRSGRRLDWSTLIGGDGTETGFISFFGSHGDVFIEGETSSPDYPTTRRAFQPSFGGGDFDGFVTRLNARGSKLKWSTFIGGSGPDGAHDGWLDERDNFYIDGPTGSADFPTTRGAFQRTFAGGDSDTFAAKVDPSGRFLHYSTYLGGSGFEDVLDMTVDRQGNAYVPGITDSEDYPTTAGAFQPAFGGVTDGYLAKLNPRGTGLVYATYVGGTDFDLGGGVRVDDRGEAHMVGITASPDFPVTRNALQPEFAGTADAFILRLDDRGARLRFSTFLGGSGDDGSAGAGEWLDDRGNFYVPGFTNSADFPVTAGSFQTESAGGYDIWLAKIAPSKHWHKGNDDVLRAPHSERRRAPYPTNLVVNKLFGSDPQGGHRWQP
jgi:hypothetical protein